MPEDDGDHEQIVRHLLGLLPELAGRAIQRRRAEDPAYDELYQAIEEELIDDFVQGRLGSEQDRRFREHYLNTPERYEKVHFAQAMLRSIGRRSAARTRVLPVALVAVLCFAAGLGTASLLRRPTAPVISCVLLPGIRRGTEAPQTIAVLPSTVMLQLHLRLDSGLSGDHAVLRPVGGDEIWWQRVAPGTSHGTGIAIPAAALSDGDYLLTLESGRQPAASYYFRIVRR